MDNKEWERERERLVPWSAMAQALASHPCRMVNYWARRSLVFADEAVSYKRCVGQINDADKFYAVYIGWSAREIVRACRALAAAAANAPSLFKSDAWQRPGDVWWMPRGFEPTVFVSLDKAGP